MAFIFELLQNSWAHASKDADKHDLANWNDFLDKLEKDRQRE